MPSKEKNKENPLKINELKGFRVRSGISAEDIAEKLDLNKLNYYKRESGKVLFTINDFITFVKVLDLNIEEIVSLFKSNVLSDLLIEYKNKIIQDTEKKEREYYMRLLKENSIDTN